MSLDLTADCFPGVAIQLIATRFALIDPSINVEMRPLRPSDPNLSISVYASTWMPTPNSYEMKGVDFSREASLQQYVILNQVMVKDANEERGIQSHSVLAELVRSILVSDAPLRTQLGGLQATLGGSTKTLQRWWVRSAKYINGQMDRHNMYLSTNELVLEVEKTS